MRAGVELAPRNIGSLGTGVELAERAVGSLNVGVELAEREAGVDGTDRVINDSSLSECRFSESALEERESSSIFNEKSLRSISESLNWQPCSLEFSNSNAFKASPSKSCNAADTSI